MAVAFGTEVFFAGRLCDFAFGRWMKDRQRKSVVYSQMSGVY